MNKLIVSVLFGLLVVSNALNVPVFMWSGDNSFNGKSAQINEKISINDLENLITYFFQKDNAIETSLLNKIMNTNQASPKLVVLFLESELRTDQISQHSSSFKSLKASFQNEKSSISAPWMEVSDASANTNAVDKAILNVAKSVEGKIIYAGKGSELLQTLQREVEVKVLKLNGLSKSLEKQSTFSSDKTDLLIVHFDSKDKSSFVAKFSSDDEIIGEVQQVVKSVVGENYVSILTGQKAADPNVQWTFMPSASETQIAFSEWVSRITIENASGCLNGTGNCSFGEDWILWFPPWFWEGFLFGIIFVWIAVCGTCGVMGIQTHDKYLTVAPKMKEGN